MTLRGSARDSVSLPRWWKIGTVVTAVAVAICCAVLIWADAAEENVFLAVYTVAVLFVLGLVWLVFVVIGIWRYRAYRFVLVAPLLVVLCIALMWSGLTDKLAWRMSKGDMERAAARCAEHSEGGRFGIYDIGSVHEIDGGCLFYTRAGFLNRVGYAYFPNGAPPTELTSPRGKYWFYDPWDGPWYTFVEQWD